MTPDLSGAQFFVFGAAADRAYVIILADEQLWFGGVLEAKEMNPLDDAFQAVLAAGSTTADLMEKVQEWTRMDPQTAQVGMQVWLDNLSGQKRRVISLPNRGPHAPPHEE